MAGVVSAMLGLLAGAFLALQATINAELSRELGGLPVTAATISFVAGAAALAVVSVLLVQLQGASIAWRAPQPWMFVAGGCLGAGFVTIALVLIPKLGAAATMAFVVTGQLLAGMILDRLGLLGVAVRDISIGRLAGAALLIAGAVLIRGN